MTTEEKLIKDKRIDRVLQYAKLGGYLIAVIIFIWQASQYTSNINASIRNKVDKDSLVVYKQLIANDLSDMNDKFDESEYNQVLFAKQIVRISRALKVEVEDDLIELSKRKFKFTK